MNKIPLAVPNLTGNESKYLQECIQSGFVSSIGPFVSRFEKELAGVCRAESAVATCSGTSALHAALTALEVGQGDLVITPSFTFIATANAISHAGASPWIFDVSEENLGLDWRLLERTLEDESVEREGSIFHRTTGKRIAAILPVYPMGSVADMKDIVRVASKYRLPVVADAAGAIGASLEGLQLGELGASLSIISFNGNKTITCGGGGAILGNDQKLLKKVKHLCSTGKVGDYTHDMIAFNYRMTNVEAAIGCAQLERLSYFVDRKREIANKYKEAFKNIKGVTPLPSNPESSHWLSGVMLSKAHYNLAKIISDLKEKGIEARPFWKPLHLQPIYKDHLRTGQGICEGIWDTILILPCSTSLKDEEQDFVINAFLKHRTVVL